MWSLFHYNDTDLDEIVELTKEYYSNIEISDKNYLKWQYENNPAGKAVIMLAKDSKTSTLAGQYVVIPMDFQVEEQVIRGTLSVNTLTRKQYQGQGIFTGLAKAVYNQCSKEGLKFTYGFPNPNSYPGFIKKLMFEEIGKVPLLIRPLDVKKLLQNKVGSLLANCLAPVNLLFKSTCANIETFKTFEIDISNAADFDKLWQRIRYKYNVMSIRNFQFIKWKYMDSPLRNYKVFGVKENEELVGYLIGRCTEIEGIKAGMIVDFLFDRGNTRAGDLLIKKIVEYFTENKMELIGSLMMRNTEEYQILTKNRFVRCPKFLEPQPFPVVYRNHIQFEKEDIMLDFDNWFLTMGDYDVI